MSSVTVKTAAATDAILAQTIKEAVVDGAGHLICTRHDDSVFDAGLVRGPQGIVGPTGDVSAAELAAAILAAKNATGFGLLDKDEVGTDQIWGFDEDGWNEITGIQVTYNQVTGRSYRVMWGALMYSGADGVTFDIEARIGGTVLARASGFALHNNRSVSVDGGKPFEAGTTGSKTIKLYARGDTANDIHINSDYVNTWLSIEDIGII